MENFNILLVGNKKHCSFYSDILQNSGYEIICGNALEAVSYLKTHHFKIIVTEFNLNNHEFNGVTIFLYSKNENSDSVVFVSCPILSVDFIKEKYAFDGILHNSMSPDEIRRFISGIVAGHNK